MFYNISKKGINTFILSLLNLYILTPKNYKERLYQEENKWLISMAALHYIFWPATFIFLFFLADYHRTPLTPFIIYRFGCSVVLWLLGGITYLVRKNNMAIKTLLVFASFIISAFISWSMTLGYPVQPVWIAFHATFIIATISNSMLASLLLVISIILLNEPLWSKQHPMNVALVLGLVFYSIILIYGYVTRKIWIQSKINQFLHTDSMQKFTDLQLQLHTEVKKFVPPVLVKKIEEQTQKDKPIAIAVDDILMRHKNDVAVLFSDIRNFSQRSTDMEFVEKELIPSSIKLIDSVEANMGIAKQIGDAIFVYYSFEGAHPDAPKEAIARAFKDAVEGCLTEKQRIKALGKTDPERFFSVTYGTALVGNMASSRHREATVIGAPANLAARMDSLTKKESFKPFIEDGNKILVSKMAKEAIDFFEANLEFIEVDLLSMDLIMKSFPDENVVYLFALTEQNLNKLNEILSTNDMLSINEDEF